MIVNLKAMLGETQLTFMLPSFGWVKKIKIKKKNKMLVWCKTVYAKLLFRISFFFLLWIYCTAFSILLDDNEDGDDSR